MSGRGGNTTCHVFRVQPVLDPTVRDFCARPYPGHPRGCPNFGKKEGCPPKAPLLDQRLDLTYPVFAVINDFDLTSHVERLKLAHPAWTDRQLRCSLYWQCTAKKAWKSGIAEFLLAHPGYSAMLCPEAMGVNVAETLLRSGIEIEWPPVNVVRQVALCGVAR